MTIRFVLTVATFSEASENAVERAAQTAARQGARLYIVHRATGDLPPRTHAQDRLAQRAAQLARRYGIEVKTPQLSERTLLRALERAAQQALVVVDRMTARQLTTGPGLLDTLAPGVRHGASLLALRACPVWIVNRPSGRPHQRTLLPYRTAQEAERSLAFARQAAAGSARELFCMEPRGSRTPAPDLGTIRLKEWPPPQHPPDPEPVTHSHYLSTRRNRTIPSFDTASTARRIGNQAASSGADLVIAPYDAPTLAGLLLRRSLRARLADALACDLAFLPDPDRLCTAARAAERLNPQRHACLLTLATAKERRHG